MKKKYILVLTFLFMLCGQSSFGQGWGGDDLPEIEICYGIDEEVYVDTFMCQETIIKSSTSFDCDTGELFNSHIISYEVNDIDCPEAEYVDTGDCTDWRSNAFPCYEDTGDDTQEPQEKIWYLDFDNDGYHGSTYPSVTSPGDKWKLYTYGKDCDDARPQYTTECCIKECESGYKLNIDTCECELLPPCFGTIKDFETSNAFNSNTILTKLNSTLGDFGISTDVMDMIKQMNLFDPKTIATGADFLKFADDLGTVGDVAQISMDYLKYIDEPSTQNLLKTVLDTAAIALSPAASLALSTIDYFKDSNGNSKLDLFLKAASDAIDRSIDCNLGLGIRNSVF